MVKLNEVQPTPLHGWIVCGLDGALHAWRALAHLQPDPYPPLRHSVDARRLAAAAARAALHHHPARLHEAEGGEAGEGMPGREDARRRTHSTNEVSRSMCDSDHDMTCRGRRRPTKVELSLVIRLKQQVSSKKRRPTSQADTVTPRREDIRSVKKLVEVMRDR